MSESRQPERALFDAALELGDPDAREAFLLQACRGNPAMHARLKRLLELHHRAEEFFRVNPRALCRTTTGINRNRTTRIGAPREIKAEPVPETIGRYRLIRRLGEGGCGVVYLAEQQEPVRRQVALKIIRLGMDTETVIARFEAERQALAMMDHPNIAHVLDAGATESGRPFFVMELVSGTKITDYCDQNRLSTDQRLRLFVQVCHAIQHAHQKGVIHRDIKPSNVLITVKDGVPAPKVIDFGIAKATQGRLTDNTLHTAQDQFIGTPAYMSPEQADTVGMDVDTRSDIYSLGVLLYELLTGRTPFDSGEMMRSGVDEIRRTLRQCEPVPPSTLLTRLGIAELETVASGHVTDPPRLISSVKGDLDWIVMKALEKDRGRRYETANGLSMDVQRYLGNEPILARPPSRFYRLGKLVRRNKLTFAAISAVSISLLTGLGTSTWMFLREREARQRAVEAEQQQFQLRKEADELRRQAEYRQRLTEATVLHSRDLVAAADELVSEIPAPAPNLEYATLFRELGDWHASYSRWKPAADRYSVLLKVNQPDDWDVTTLDYLRYGPALLEAGDYSEYERFRHWAVDHFQATTNPVPAERVVKVSLLTPPDAAFLESLGPLAATASNSLAHAAPESMSDLQRSLSSWRSFSLAMMEFRRGNPAGFEMWHSKSIAYEEDDRNPVRALTFQIIRSMILHQAGNTALARAELDHARPIVEQRFQDGRVASRPGDGYWFDWVFAHILIREAAAQLAESPGPPAAGN